MTFHENWVIQARKGLLEALILRLLLDGERYGYDLAREIERWTGAPCSRGTLYPLLRRLQGHGLVALRRVDAADGPPRKYFAITLEGRTAAVRMGRFLAPFLPGSPAPNRGPAAPARAPRPPIPRSVA